MSHSARRVRLQTTLSTIDLRLPDREGRTLPNPGRPAVERAAMLRGLGPTAEEIRWLDQHVENKGILEALGASDPLALPAALAKAREGVEGEIVRKLATYRHKTIEHGITTVKAALSSAEDAWIEAESSIDSNPHAATPSEQGERALPLPSIVRKLFAQCAAFDGQPLGLRIRSVLGSPHVSHGHKQTIRSSLQKLGVRVEPAFFHDDWAAVSQQQKALSDIASAQPDVGASLVSPIGWLHLERLSHAPAGIEHGELLSSLPLAPGVEHGRRVSAAHVRPIRRLFRARRGR